MASWSAISGIKRWLGLSSANRLGELRVIRDEHQCLAILSLEMADTLRRRAKGLMGRTALDGVDGMLFVYPWPRIARIWMAGTLIPLDAVFVDRFGIIVKIATGLQPHDKKWVSSGSRVKWVVELVAGRSEALGIKVGDRVRINPA